MYWLNLMFCICFYDIRDCLHMFFFFKQKTAYEMRISDWSSDVCSSDLSVRPALNTCAFSAVKRWIASSIVCWTLGPCACRCQPIKGRPSYSMVRAKRVMAAPLAVRVERSRDTPKAWTIDGHLDFARCERD